MDDAHGMGRDVASPSMLSGSPGNIERTRILSRGVSWATDTSRYGLVALCFLAVVVGYTDRVNLAVAAVAMREQLHWTQTTKGVVLSAFFVGYMSSMAICGWLATRFGGIRVLGVAVLWWSLFTLLTPPAAMSSLTALVAARIGMGVGEAAMIPACYQLIGRWLPESGRTRAVTRILSGIPAGMIAGLSCSGWLVTRWGWPSSFYVFGLVGFVWCAVWWAWAKGIHPCDEVQVPAGKVSNPPRWGTLLRKPAILALFVGHFSANWLLFFFLSWLPSYFKDGLGLSITHAGLFSAGPWLAMGIASNVAGTIADRLCARGTSVILVRKVMQAVGLLTPAVCLFLLQNVTSVETALVLVCLSAGALGCSWAGYAANAIDLAPRRSSIIMGISNTVATIPGIVGVSITGWFFDVTGTFASAFLLTAAVSAVGALVFIVFASARPLLD